MDKKTHMNLWTSLKQMPVYDWHGSEVTLLGLSVLPISYNFNLSTEIWYRSRFLMYIQFFPPCFFLFLFLFFLFSSYLSFQMQTAVTIKTIFAKAYPYSEAKESHPENSSSRNMLPVRWLTWHLVRIRRLARLWGGKPWAVTEAPAL